MTPGRNEASPCGSGKKYEKRCLAKEHAARAASTAEDAAAEKRSDHRRTALDALSSCSMRQQFSKQVQAHFEAYRLDRLLAAGASEVDVHLKFYVLLDTSSHE